MSDTVIKAENISKQYRLGQVGSKTMAADFKRWLYKLQGKEDPFAKIGETNDRASKGSSEYVWALRDINFEVKQGEVLGIIGRNGAGKSTLLKLLSRVTTPTTGKISIHGRMATLLEVGTGFHPELTGRENVFLNGAIMGMSKAEIKSKFDEIVDFAGVERYIDTPVKRYSSGMHVRLGFAVAAHLEPEILVIDEVLAVGDAEFQKKCLGKMKSVSGEGRTVLFVSHNMGAIQKLCTRGILLKNGTIFNEGSINDVVNDYLKDNLHSNNEFDITSIPKSQVSYFTKVKFLNSQLISVNKFKFGEDFSIILTIVVNKPIKNLVIALGLINSYDVSINTNWTSPNYIEEPGIYEIIFKYNKLILEVGNYKLTASLSDSKNTISYIEDIASFTVSTQLSSPINERIQKNENVGALLNQMDYIINKIK